MESSLPPVIEEKSEYAITTTSVVISSEPLKSHRANYQILTYLLHEEKKLVHLLNLILF